MSTSIAAPKLNSARGFLPLQDPLTHLPQAFDTWESVACGLPKLLASDHIRRTIQELPAFPLDEVTNDRERERAMMLLSYLGHAYVWRDARPAEVLPKQLAVPWHAVAESLGRPPVLSYSSYALHNFFRFDTEREIECGNIGLIQNFMGGIDEEWFILVHVEIERKAAPGMAALHACLDAAEARDAARVESLLATVRVSIDSMDATLKRMPEWCDPYIYYHRVQASSTRESKPTRAARNSFEAKLARRARLFLHWTLCSA
jgi:indoleamine 2,3-dioxygenase